jgi:anti-sigma regulatory factor (Ser/Thr protein kinase)
LDKLKNGVFDLIICDINLPDKDGFYVLRMAAELYPKIKRTLITAYDVDTYLELVKQEKVYNVITKSVPFNFEELSTVINNLLVPSHVFGLENYLGDSQALSKIILHSSHDIITVQAKVKEFFGAHQVQNLDIIAVVLIEAMTNAVYHSTKNPDGTDQYEKGQVIESLSPSQEVTVTYGKDDDKIGVSIRDQGGTIKPDEIIYWMERNVSGNSLMDTHGRGIFLIHRLMDRVIINVAHNRSTELILMHYLNGMASENKPIYINEIP